MISACLLFLVLGRTFAEDAAKLDMEELGLLESEFEAQAHAAMLMYSDILGFGGAGRPNFSGLWIQARVTGDTDGLLKALGMNWFVRSIVKNAKYGVGKLKKNITQEGDHFRCENFSPAGYNVEEFTVGAGRESTKDGQGHRFDRDVQWDGNVLVMHMWKKGVYYTARVSLENDELVKVTQLGSITSTEVMTRTASLK